MTDTQGGNAPTASFHMAVNNQYIKDLSFESPHAPAVFTALDSMPELKIGVNVQTRPLAENTYEVVLLLKMEAESGEKTAFIVELAYGGVFSVSPLPDDALRYVLLVEAPRLLFPFARSIVSSAVRDGGFPPLLIHPIDFAGMYKAQQDQMAKPAAGTA